MKILMLLDNPFEGDLRVEREVSTLASAGYTLQLYCLKKKGLSDEGSFQGVPIKRFFDERIFDVKKPLYLRKIAEQLLKDAKITPSDDLVLHCHDHTMLHLGAMLKRRIRNSRLIYDSHEMFHAWPLNLAPSLSRSVRIKSRLVRQWQVIREGRNAKYIDYLITVSDSISSVLKKYFRLKRDPLTLRNTPSGREVTAPPSLKEQLGLPADHTLLLFMAGHLYEKSQNLEQVIDQLGNQPKTALMILSGEGPGKRYFTGLAEKKGYGNIFFHERIEPSGLIDFAAACDAGLLPYWNKTDLSYWYSLPNKLFEYIMAGIPVLGTRQPEFLKIIEHYHIGICTDPDEPGAFLNGLRELTARQQEFRAGLQKAQKELNWEKEQKKLLELYRSIEQKAE